MSARLETAAEPNNGGPRRDLLVATESRTIDGVKVVAGVTRVSADHPWAQLGGFELTSSPAGTEAIAKRSKSKEILWFTKPATEAWRLA